MSELSSMPMMSSSERSSCLTEGEDAAFRFPLFADAAESVEVRERRVDDGVGE